MDQRQTFDAVAGLYAEARPGYPAALFDDLEALAGLGPTAAVLEVGCGAGQATCDLAARAGRVVAIDPGPALIEEARRRAGPEAVTFVVARFEDIPLEPGSFQLVASAQAWHWVDPATGYAKAADALAPGGALAVFGHVPRTPEGPLGEAFKAIYDRYLPGAWGTPSTEAAYQPTGPYGGEIGRSGRFGPVTHREYRWTWPLTPDLFGRFLRTDSSFHVLAEGPRFALFDALSAAVADQGGVWDAEWETHLYVARKA
jgi:SAM-dependent methyltransferase